MVLFRIRTNRSSLTPQNPQNSPRREISRGGLDSGTPQLVSPPPENPNQEPGAGSLAGAPTGESWGRGRKISIAVSSQFQSMAKVKSATKENKSSKNSDQVIRIQVHPWISISAVFLTQSPSPNRSGCIRTATLHRRAPGSGLEHDQSNHPSTRRFDRSILPFSLHRPLAIASLTASLGVNYPYIPSSTGSVHTVRT